jgi:hypothetical protein
VKDSYLEIIEIGSYTPEKNGQLPYCPVLQRFFPHSSPGVMTTAVKLHFEHLLFFLACLSAVSE